MQNHAVRFVDVVSVVCMMVCALAFSGQFLLFLNFFVALIDDNDDDLCAVNLATNSGQFEAQ